MPNIFSAIGRAVMPRRIRAEDFMMDRNGITGQEMRDEVVPKILDDASLDDPSVSPSGLPTGIPPSYPTNGQVAPDIEDAYVRKIATDAMNRPQLPKAPSGWRSILATIAGSTRGGQAFAPLIAYGPKGLSQISEYQRYESELPEKIKLGNMVTNQRNAEVNDRLRQDTLNSTNANRELTDRTSFGEKGGEWRSIDPLSTGMSAQPTQVETPSMLPPTLKGKFGSPSISELPPPINLGPTTLPGGSVSMTGKEPTGEGFFSVPTPRSEATQGIRRVQATPAHMAQAKLKDETVNWPIVSTELATKFPEYGIKAGEKIAPETLRSLISADTQRGKDQPPPRTPQANDLRNIEAGNWNDNPWKITPQQAKQFLAQADNGEPLYPVVQGNQIVYRPRSQAAGQAAPRTLYDPQGMPSVGGNQGMSTTPPPTIPATQQNRISGFTVALKQAGDIQDILNQNPEQAFGPVAGRVTLAEIGKLGGMGASQKEIEIATRLQRFLSSQAFADGGKQLTPTELEQFALVSPALTDTLPTALTKTRLSIQFLKDRGKADFDVMPPRQKQQLSKDVQDLFTGLSQPQGEKIKVIRKSDKKPGTIDAKDWDPAKYDKR